MHQIQKLLRFVKPYWRRSLVSLIFLILVIVIDLTIPRLIQRIIDQGINGNNMYVVLVTTFTLLDAKGFFHHLYMSQFKGIAI